MDDKISRQKEHFDAIAERYERARQHPNHLRLKELIWTELMGDYLTSLPSQIKVLEPMCGFADGRSILTARTDRPIDYYGFDYSSEVVERLNAKRPELHVWQQDVSQFESEERFDVIILLGGLHHVPHIAGDVVARLSRCLADGGLFINLEPTHGNRLFKAIREAIYKRNSLFDEETERAFSVQELRDFFESCDLEAVNILYPGLLAYVLYYNPDAFPYLNIGKPGLVNALWALEKPIVRSGFAKALSFATLSVWQQKR